MLIHGWSCDRKFWTDQVNALASRYRVVALDLPGHGESGAERESWTLEAFGGDVITVVEHLGLDRVILVGHSMGGYVALEAARKKPGKFTGIVGIDTMHDAGVKQDWTALIADYEKDFEGTCARFIRSLFGEGASETLVKQTIQGVCNAQPDLAVAIFRQFPEYDLADAMRSVEIPIRCINAARNPTNVEGNRRFANFDVVTMEGVGHFPMLEQPEELNHLLIAVLQEIAG